MKNPINSSNRNISRPDRWTMFGMDRRKGFEGSGTYFLQNRVCSRTFLIFLVSLKVKCLAYEDCSSGNWICGFVVGDVDGAAT